MTHRRSELRRAVPGLIASAAVAATACFHRGSADVRPPQPAQASLPQVTAAPAPASTPPGVVLTMPTATADAAEPIIPYWVGPDLDVRLVLQKIAELGKMDLVVPSTIKKTISIYYVNTPVSVALKDVLARSGLRLGTANAAPLPYDTVTVFYRLPANVDSMSSEAIVKRFGISKELADLIVKARKP